MKRSGKCLLAGGILLLLFTAYVCFVLLFQPDALPIPAQGTWVLYACWLLLTGALFFAGFLSGLLENRKELTDFSARSILFRLSCLFRLISSGMLAISCFAGAAYFLLLCFDAVLDFPLSTFVLNGFVIALVQLLLSAVLGLFARKEPRRR